MVFAVHTDAAHGLEQPFDDRAFGIVVQACDAALCFGPFPGFPNGGRARFGHKEPAGHLLVFQQPIGCLHIEFRQHVQDQRRRQKACAEPPAVVLQRFDQAFLGKRLLLRIQKIECKRTHQQRLPIGIEVFSERLLIGRAAFFRNSAVFCPICRALQLLRNLRHAPQHIGGVSGADLWMGQYHIFPVVWLDVRRLGPLAVALPPAHDAVRRNTPDHEASVFLHTVVVPREDLPFAVLLPEAIRQQDPDIRPAHRAVHGPHIEIHPAVGCDLGQAAAAPLPVVHVPQIFLRKRRIVEEIGRRFKEDLRVPRPAVAFPGGAVGGNVKRIGLRGPFGGLHEAVQKLVGALEAPSLLHVGVDGDGLRVFRQQLHLRLHLRIAEAEDRKGGFIYVPPFAAGVVDLLQRGGLLFADALDVFQRQIAVLVQHLAESPKHALPLASVCRECHIAREILPEVQKGFSVWRNSDRRMQTLVLRDRNIVRCGRNDRMMRFFRVPTVRGRAVGLDDLTVLVVGKADGAVVGPLPAAVGNHGFHETLFILNFQLAKEFRFRAVLVGDAPRAAGTAIPSVGQLHRQLVFAALQHGGHIIGLVLNALFVVCQTRRKAEAADLFAIELGLI